MLCYSSLFFMTNAITSFWVNNYRYSFLFSMLTMTSLMHHTYYTIYTWLIDQVFVVSITAYGGNLFYQKYVPCKQTKFIETALMMCLFLFYYGYCTNCYCFHPDKHIGNQYHFLLHFIGSLGHHGIILL